MFSSRFAIRVVVTSHARERMQQRKVSDSPPLQILDEGSLRYRDAVHVWAWMEVPGRDDNLICAALVLEVEVIVKSVMHRSELLP